MTDRPTPEQFICQLLKHVPELQRTYDEHLQDNEELLPHVLFGEVSRYVVQQVRANENALTAPVSRILDCLEQGVASGDEQVRNLVSASFVENLAEYDDVLARLKALMGPNLEKEFKNHGK